MAVERNARWHTAVHEAAHVVVARDSGFPVSWVSIDRRFLDEQGLGVQHEGAFLAEVDHLVRPIAARGAFISRHERETAERYCAMMMAGGLVEIEYGGIVQSTNLMGDKAQIDRLVASIESLRFKRKAWAATCHARAQETIARRRGDIERLADALCECGTIMEPV